VAEGVTNSMVAASAAVAGSLIGVLGSLLTSRMETWRKKDEDQNRRRDERKKAYLQAIDLLTNWQWSSEYPEPDADKTFTLGFVRSCTRVRVYGSPASRAAVDRIQQGLGRSNDAAKANDREAAGAAYAMINRGLDDLVEAAREDVGPRPADGLAKVPYVLGAGPRT
jgi:hypothetical protein